MVVTCPSCQARYRLDPSRIKGRGAKIRCPKCAHSFVVYRDDEGGAGSQNEIAGQQAPNPATAYAATGTADHVPFGDAKTVVNRAPEGTPVAPHVAPPDEEVPIAVGGKGGAATSTKPPPKKTPSAESFNFSAAMGGGAEMATGAQVAVGGAPAPKSSSSDPIAARLAGIGEHRDPKGRPITSTGKHVEELRYREVGIRGWRAKVAMGLEYAFDDYRTFQKYLEEGKVARSDRVSYDGKNWHVISELGDIENWFVRVWDAARKAKAEGALSDPKKPTSSSSGKAAPSSGEAPIPAGPATTPKAKPTTVARPRPGLKKKPRIDWSPIHVVYGVLSLVIFIVILSKLTGGEEPPQTQTQATEVEPSRSTQPDRTQPVEPRNVSGSEDARAPAPADPLADLLSGEKKPYQPDLPDGMRVGIVAPPPASSFQTENSLAKKSADEGVVALHKGETGEALKSLVEAVRIEPSNALYRYHLARAYEKSGRFRAAAQSCGSALELDPNLSGCYKMMGDILRGFGDANGAASYYRKYLRLAPDAPEGDQLEEFLMRANGAGL